MKRPDEQIDQPDNHRTQLADSEVPLVVRTKEDINNINTFLDDQLVCQQEALLWDNCVHASLSEPRKMRHKCDNSAILFERCVSKWRENGNADKKIKGYRPGHPPLQCVGISANISECIRMNQYRFEDCIAPCAYFKRCVKALYGNEYIME
eukprot:Tbor_TRINITY_DN4667_c0_g2::TRINITY_DN4667_c0_g2_i1::g.14823::m.14823